MGIFQRLAQVFVRQTPEREERPTEIGPAKTAGYQSFYHYWGRYPRDLPTFSFLTIQMMLIEPTIRLGLAMRAAPMRSIEWGWKDGQTWNPGIQAQDPDVATYVERQLKRIWADLDAVLTAQIWGWAGGEVVLRLNPTTEQVEVDRLLPRHANDLRARAYEGQPCGVRVLRINSHTNGYIDLDWPKGFWHAFNPECGRHYGESVLLGCYSPWWDKWMDGGGLDVRRLFMHKDAYAGADLTYPEGNQYINNQEVPNRDIAREIVEQLVAGGVTTRPAQYDAGGNELWKLTRAAVASSPGHILQYPKDLDVEMLRGMGIPDDVLTSENTGAWEGKKVPMAAFYAGLDSWAGQLIRDMDATVIRPLVKLNWGCDQEYEIGHKPLGEQALESQANGGKADKQGDGGGFSDLFGGGDSGEDPGPQDPAPQPGPQPGQRMSLAVGRGVVQAAELVKAAQRVMRMRTEKGDGVPVEKLHFGIADNLPDDAFDADELARGTLHEMEHTDDPDVAKEIAKDHLAEDPDYYKKLEAVAMALKLPKGGSATIGGKEVHWVTIGGKAGEHGEHEGGFPVALDADGNIVAGGPRGLRGKHVSEAKAHFDQDREGKGKDDEKTQKDPSETVDNVLTSRYSQQAEAGATSEPAKTQSEGGKMEEKPKQFVPAHWPKHLQHGPVDGFFKKSGAGQEVAQVDASYLKYIKPGDTFVVGDGEDEPREMTVATIGQQFQTRDKKKWVYLYPEAPKKQQGRDHNDDTPPEDPLDRMEWERRRELGRTGELPGA